MFVVMIPTCVVCPLCKNIGNTFPSMIVARINGNPQGCFYYFYSFGTMMGTRTKQQMEILHSCTNKNCNNTSKKKKNQ
jgi:hypothetical protein